MLFNVVGDMSVANFFLFFEFYIIENGKNKLEYFLEVFL